MRVSFRNWGIHRDDWLREKALAHALRLADCDLGKLALDYVEANLCHEERAAFDKKMAEIQEKEGSHERYA